MPGPFSARYHPVLGTDLHVLVGTDHERDAERAQTRVVDELVRLEGLLSAYQPQTPLSRWTRGEPVTLPDEVVTVLALAGRWFVASGGSFHPALGRVRERWHRAVRDAVPPDPEECRGLAHEASVLPFRVVDDSGAAGVERTGDGTVVDLDALAKGWIVDRALEAGLATGVEWLLVNVGGDLRVAGEGSVRVAVEDPASALDNAPPLGTVELRASALASSGSARRGFRVGDRWFGHVLDPRTGWPVPAGTGATVVAPDAATADVLATVVGVAGLDHPPVTTLLDRHRAAAVYVTPDGTVHRSRAWVALSQNGFGR